jgi:hypothetical protein
MDTYVYKFILVKQSSVKVPSNDLRREVNGAVRACRQRGYERVQYDGRKAVFHWNAGVPNFTADVFITLNELDVPGFTSMFYEKVRRSGWEPGGALSKGQAVGTGPIAVVPPAALPDMTTLIPVVGETPETAPMAVPDEPMPPMNVARGDFFDHIFDRDDQIEIMLSAIRAFHVSGHASRFHSLLHGPPGCGKTEVLRAVHNMLGEQHSMILDGPSTTKAGAEQMFLGIDRIKPVVLIEEIEKMSPYHMSWLLQLLDKRGEIRKTTARHGNVQRDVRVLCIATVNDLEKFKSRMHGALSSRFAHEIYFPKPDEDILRKILAREIKEVPGGDLAWVDPTIRYCLDLEGTNDPRRLISVCLSGREGLLDGTYLRALSLNRKLRQIDVDTQPWSG